MGSDSETSSNSSHDRHGKKKPKVKGNVTFKNVVGGCCFWLRIMPPIKWFLGFFKWLFMTKHEYEILKTAKKLFKTCNADQSCCADCPYKKLGGMERMYLHRILQDEQRWGRDEYAKFIGTFRGQLKAYQAETSDAGADITEEEFVSAVLIATQTYMMRLVDRMKTEVKKEYEKDGKEAGVEMP